MLYKYLVFAGMEYTIFILQTILTPNSMLCILGSFAAKKIKLLTLIDLIVLSEEQYFFTCPPPLRFIIFPT